MCESCLKTVCPDRGESTFEGGAYMINYRGCQECQNSMEIVNKDVIKREDEDGTETVSCTHACKACGHEIARHEYTFEVVDGYQIKEKLAQGMGLRCRSTIWTVTCAEAGAPPSR